MASKKDVFTHQLVKSYLEDLAGPNAVKVAKSLPVTKAKSEYDVADDIKININKLRSILYKFYSKNLVVYNRQRDAKKGWYIYHWKFFPDKLVHQIILDKNEGLKKIKPTNIPAGEKQVYVCTGCREHYSFTSAFNHNFICPTCRVSLKVLDVDKLNRKARREGNKIKKEIEELKKLL